MLFRSVGEDNVAVTSFPTLCGRFDMAVLEGKLFVQMNEFRMGSHTDVASGLDNVLAFTSGNRMRMERKGRDAQPMARLYGKLGVTMNGMPAGLKDDSAALVRRLLPLPCRAFEGKPDRGLRQKLAGEAAGIFMWALDGLCRLKRRGEFLLPDAGAKLREDWERQMSPFKAFVADWCVPVGGVKKSVLWQVFKAKCKEAGHSGLAEISDVEFGRRIHQAVPGLEGKAVTIDGDRTNIYTPLRLLTREDREAMDRGVPKRELRAEPQLGVPAEYGSGGDAGQDKIPW